MSEDFPAQLAWFRPGSLVAGYRLEAQVGTGGMAVVFRARDERLGRLVALKILAPVLAADGTFRRRFIAESRAAAAVDDPHIIPVHEAGEADGVLFIAMRFVSGGDLRRVLELQGALRPGRAAEFISPVASALDAAHAAGLVHRDVKPANILVDARPGRPDHVYLSDFGVSKGAGSSASLTGTGQFLGTPDYSAPEQIQGRAVDGRTDQYALACVAYQLLTGQTPFERDQGMAVLLAHLSEPPPALSSRRLDLPEAADRVLAQALAKVPEKRYRSCGDFADALREALGLAPYAPAEEAPPPMASAMPEQDISAAPVTVTAASLPTGEPATAADGMVRPVRRRRRLLTTALAGTALAVTAIVVPFLARSPASPRPSISQVSSASQKPAQTLASANASSVVFSPKGGIAATGGGNEIQLWNLTSPTTRTPNLVDPNDPDIITSFAFSPSGVTVAGTDDGGFVYLWNTSTGQLTASLAGSCDGGTSVAFSPNGAILAATGVSSICLWNVATGGLRASLAGPGSKGVTSAAFSPNGATLAAADGNGDLYLWNVATGKLNATLTDPGSKGVTSAAFSPNGMTLAAGDENGGVYLWNAVTGKLNATLTDPGGVSVTSVAFSPTGSTLATADESGSAYLWKIG